MAKGTNAKILPKQPPINAVRCDPPLPGGELANFGTSIGARPDRYQHTDLGNAERLIDRHGADLRFCPQVRKWLHWDGERWLWDDDGDIVRRATDTIRAIYGEAQQVKDADKRKALVGHATRSEGRMRIDAMIKLAESLDGVPLPITRLDADRGLLGIVGGVLDLRTGHFQPAVREHHITKRANVSFDPNAACPRWLKFLDEIFAGNADVISFVQRIVGYSLTGETSEQCLFVLFGNGANGKSVFLRIIHALLGDYAMQAVPDTFMEAHRGTSATNDLARLRGARLVSASEPDEDCILAEGVVKQLTGQNKVTCRFLYQEFFEYLPQFKILLATNHKPEVKGGDYAIWRRLHLIPFEVTIPPERQDKTLAEKIIGDELPGVLTWALHGLAAWRDGGLVPPAAVVVATKAYREDMDIIGDWIDQDCEVSPDLPFARTSKLFESYKGFCEGQQIRPLNARQFGRKLAERGFKARKGTAGTRGFCGIDVRE